MFAALVRGSSPLTRGKLIRRDTSEGQRRLIPAHAGKTLEGEHVPTRCPAHPRSRGENLTGAEDQLVSLGSSPLTRGKPSNGFRAESARRLIPAHAGKTVGA